MIIMKFPQTTRSLSTSVKHMCITLRGGGGGSLWENMLSTKLALSKQASFIHWERRCEQHWTDTNPNFTSSWIAQHINLRLATALTCPPPRTPQSLVSLSLEVCPSPPQTGALGKGRVGALESATFTLCNGDLWGHIYGEWRLCPVAACVSGAAQHWKDSSKWLLLSKEHATWEFGIGTFQTLWCNRVGGG